MKKAYCSIIISFCFTVASFRSMAQPGYLDPTFGTAGKVTTDIGSADDFGYAPAVQTDGKILVAAFSANLNTMNFALVRYNTDGTLDNTFGTGGKVTTATESFWISSGLSDENISIALQTDGKIVLGANGRDPDFFNYNNNFSLARYHTDGAIDSSFGTTGIVQFDFTGTSGGTGDYGHSVLIQGDGKIVIAGYTIISPVSLKHNFALARCNSDGTPDSTFGTGGKVTTAIGSNNDEAFSVAIQSDGKLVVAGGSYDISNPGGHQNFALARYNTDGTLDNSFGIGGMVTSNLNIASTTTGGFASSVVIQPDGKIVAFGRYNNNGNHDFALIRYNTDGTTDSTFGTSGVKLTAVATSGLGADWGYSAVLQGDGKIVTTGYQNGSSSGFGLTRHNSDGTLDLGFGGGPGTLPGTQKTSFGSVTVGKGAALQSDGKIVMAGCHHNGTHYELAVARYNGGTVDIAENTVEANGISISPNPSTDQITVKINCNSSQLNLKMYDMHGKQEMDKTIHADVNGKCHEKLDITNLSAGLYVIIVSTEAGFHQAKKFIKQY